MHLTLKILLQRTDLSGVGACAFTHAHTGGGIQSGAVGGTCGSAGGYLQIPGGNISGLAVIFYFVPIAGLAEIGDLIALIELAELCIAGACAFAYVDIIAGAFQHITLAEGESRRAKCKRHYKHEYEREEFLYVEFHSVPLSHPLSGN